MYTKEALDKMREIVSDCMGDAPPFCEAACPMHTDVKGYVNFIAEGDAKGAIKLIREKLFMPGCLGRICAHPCEDNCTRGDIENSYAMSIAELKRYAANFDDPSEWDIATGKSSGKSIAIIGAGPAGAQAAIKLRKAGHSVVVYEKLPVPGGMLRVGIPEYRLQSDVVTREFSYIEKLGAKILFNTEVGKDISFETLRKSHDAVLIATGLHKSVILPIKGAELTGVIPAIDMLREVRLSGKYSVGKKAVVIGGGNVAMDAARTLRRLGADEVKLFCLESREEMPAHDWEIVEAEEEGVEINCGWGPVEIQGENGRVCGITFKQCLSVFDAEKRFAPLFNENETIYADIENVCMAVGQTTDISFIPDDIGIVKERGKVKADPITFETTLSGVFAAGDALRPLLAIEAMAQGNSASISIDRYLNGMDLRENRDKEGSYETWLDKDIVLEKNHEPKTRVVSRLLSPDERVKDFSEFNLGFDDYMAKKEAQRCVKCECRMCVKECLMLDDYCECPKELFEKIINGEQIDPIVPFSCNMCNQCTLECPKEFKMSDRFYDIRKEMVKEGKAPLKSHGPIMMHQKLGFSRMFNISVPSPDGNTKSVFFPGCSLPSYNPEAVGKTFEYLINKVGNVGAILKCCGKPLKAIGMMDDFHKRFHEVEREVDALGAEEIIVACQSCYVTFQQYMPGKKITSLWELMPRIGLPEGVVKNNGLKFAVHDSCVTRDVPEIHDGIRWIMNELGVEIEELEHTRENTRCCGFGGMIVPVNPELAKRVMERRACESHGENMVTYCAACRTSMIMGGKNALHILDLVFGGDWRGRKMPKIDGAISSWVKRYKSKIALRRIAEALKKR